MHRPQTFALVALTAAAVTLAAPSAEARRARGVKKLAMKHFDVSGGDLKVLGTAKGASKGGAALVRLENSDVPVCHMLQLDGPPRRATTVVKAVRLPTCASYAKEARKARLERVQLTEHKSAYRVFILSKRMDAIAKGVETRRMWGLYADVGAGFRSVFERTSTSFKSQKNKAVNQSETCEAPSFPVGSKPSTLSITCKTETMLGGAVKRKTNTYKYSWMGGRFVLQ